MSDAADRAPAGRRPHRTAVYQIDPLLFRDGEGHGWGTFGGIEAKLDYVASLGVSTIWLQPFYPCGDRDGGYDVVDHCRVDPRVGDEAAFDRLVRAAESRGLEVVIELVMQHTSTSHPWFMQAREDRRSPYRDYYIWTDTPERDGIGPIFPPVEHSIWRWDAIAGQYYRHRFYSHEPDLDLANPAVREEMAKIMRFWLARGIAGFRVDAAPYMVQRAACADPRDDGLWLLEDMHRIAREHHPDPLLIGECDVPAERYGRYLGTGNRLSHLLDFNLNNHFFLALARGDGRVVTDALAEYDAEAPPGNRMAWLRNNDELDLEQLTEGERMEVLSAFAPEPGQRIYRRGIRRRLAPMLGGDEDRNAMVHALLLSLGQIPVLRYGEEIGIGEELELPERNAVRVPMQWHDGHAAGFTDGPLPWRGPVDGGLFDYRRVNVAAQDERPDSLLSRIRTLMAARRRLPAFDAVPRFHDAGTRHVFCALFDGGGECIVAVVNLSHREQCARLPERFASFEPVLACNASVDGHALVLRRYGYAWLRAQA